MLRRSSPMRKSILPLSIHTICSCGCLWAAACAPALMFHHTIMHCLPARTRRLILSVTRSTGSAASSLEPEQPGIRISPPVQPRRSHGSLGTAETIMRNGFIQQAEIEARPSGSAKSVTGAGDQYSCTRRRGLRHSAQARSAAALRRCRRAQHRPSRPGSAAAGPAPRARTTRGTSGTMAGNCAFSVAGGVPVLSAAGQTRMPPCALTSAALVHGLRSRRPGEIDVRPAGRAKRDQRRDARIAGDERERLAGAALEIVGEEAALRHWPAARS